MPKSGLFAGEVTQAAPADGAITTKGKGYHWMEYGIYVPPTNCNEIWDIATVVPDLHVAGLDALGVWDADVLIGTGVLSDDHLSQIFVPSIGGAYSAIGVGTAAAMGLIDCQRYIYSGAYYRNDLQYPSADLTAGTWTPVGTGSRSFDQVGIDGSANTATLLTDSGGSDAYGVSVRTSFNGTTFDGNPETVRVTVKKDVTATKWGFVTLGFWGGSNLIYCTFNPADGAMNLISSVGTNPAYESLDRGDWWEFYIKIDKDGGGSPLHEAVAGIYPSWSSDGLVKDNSATGQITVGNFEILQDFSIGLVRGAANGRTIVGAGGTEWNESLAYINVTNHDQTEGGYYFEWRPMYSAAEVSADVEILSLNGGLNLLYYNHTTQELTSTDGTNTATVSMPIVADTKYRLGVIWGDYLQVGYDTVWGSEVPYDGGFPTGTQFDILSAPEAANYWRELRGYFIGSDAARAEINILMAG